MQLIYLTRTLPLQLFITTPQPLTLGLIINQQITIMAAPLEEITIPLMVTVNNNRIKRAEKVMG